MSNLIFMCIQEILHILHSRSRSVRMIFFVKTLAQRRANRLSYNSSTPCGAPRSTPEPKVDRWLDILVSMDTSEARKATMPGTVEGIPAGGSTSLPGPGHGPEDETRDQAGGCLPGEGVAGREAAAVSGRYEAGVGAQRGVSGGFVTPVAGSPLGPFDPE